MSQNFDLCLPLPIKMIDPTIVTLERQFHDFNETCNIAVGDANTMHLRQTLPMIIDTHMDLIRISEKVTLFVPTNRSENKKLCLILSTLQKVAD